MSGRLAKQLEREKRDAEVMRRLVEGQSYRTISAETGVSLSTIGKISGNARAEWRKQRLDSVDEIIAAEVAVIRHVRAEAFRAFQQSKEDEIETRTHVEYSATTDPQTGQIVKTPVRTDTVRTVRARLPDAKYLDTVMKTADRLAKLLGLDPKPNAAPGEGQGVGDLFVTINLQELPDDELETMHKLYKRAARTIEHSPDAGLIAEIPPGAPPPLPDSDDVEGASE